jgi:hypothetical protein
VPAAAGGGAERLSPELAVPRVAWPGSLRRSLRSDALSHRQPLRLERSLPAVLHGGIPALGLEALTRQFAVKTGSPSRSASWRGVSPALFATSSLAPAFISSRTTS